MTKIALMLLGCAIILLGVCDAYGQSRRGSSRWGRDRRDSSSRDNRSSNSGSQRRVRFKTAHERLPKGLPDWFVEKDANQDGQVMMSEFATRWTDGLVEEFQRFDQNGDGVVTPKECLTAREAGAVFSGSSGSTAVPSTPSSGSPSSTGTREPPDAKQSDVAPSKAPLTESTPATGAGDASTGQDAADATVENASKDSSATDDVAKTPPQDPPAAEEVKIPESYLKHAVSYIRMYDKDGNGSLTTDEWEQMHKSPKAADLDADGSVTPREFALSIMKR